jgi:hypothetical protein
MVDAAFLEKAVRLDDRLTLRSKLCAVVRQYALGSAHAQNQQSGAIISFPVRFQQRQDIIIRARSETSTAVTHGYTATGADVPDN